MGNEVGGFMEALLLFSGYIVAVCLVLCVMCWLADKMDNASKF